MNTLDFWLLATIKTLGGVAVSLFFVACIHELVWFIYRNLVGWPVVLEALKEYRAKRKDKPNA